MLRKLEWRLSDPTADLMTPVRAKKFAIVRKAVLDLGPHDKYKSKMTEPKLVSHSVVLMKGWHIEKSCLIFS